MGRPALAAFFLEMFKPVRRVAARMPEKRTTRKTARKSPARPKFGRPGTAGKAEGDAAVKVWIAQADAKHRAVIKKIDGIIGAAISDVKRAIKWSSAMYGVEGKGYFVSMAHFTNHVALRFFAGTQLSPPPPLGTSKGMRSVNIDAEHPLDEAQLRKWVKQASSIKGWGTA